MPNEQVQRAPKAIRWNDELDLDVFMNIIDEQTQDFPFGEPLVLMTKVSANSQ